MSSSTGPLFFGFAGDMYYGAYIMVHLVLMYGSNIIPAEEAVRHVKGGEEKKNEHTTSFESQTRGGGGVLYTKNK